MAAKAKSTKKPPMPAKWGTLPAADLDALVAYLQSPEVAESSVTQARRARSPSARDRRRAARDGGGRGVHRPGDRGAGGDCSTIPYAGLVVFIVVPALLVLGLLLIPLGMWLERRKRIRDPQAPSRLAGLRLPPRAPCAGRRCSSSRSPPSTSSSCCSPATAACTAMESPGFCGQVCHTPMKPQFTRLERRAACAGRVRRVPHRRGRRRVRQGQAEWRPPARPRRQPTPIRGRFLPAPNMPPGAQAEACGGCHRADRTVGDRIRVIREYADDETNYRDATVLQMHIGAASASGRAIHWHADPAVRIEYIATDDDARDDPVRQGDRRRAAQVREYVTADASDRSHPHRHAPDDGLHRLPQHRRAPDRRHRRNRAVDEAIAAGQISRQLPHARREAVRLVKASYPSQDDGAGRDRVASCRAFYRSQGASIGQSAAVARNVAALQAVYRRNVFPTMKVTWGTYPDDRGHITRPAAFAATTTRTRTQGGAVISADCESCHKQIDAPQ